MPGAGEVTREANPLPGRAGSWSGRLNRRWTSSTGVRRTSPKPSAVFGSTRLPSHFGGARPTMGRPLSARLSRRLRSLRRRRAASQSHSATAALPATPSPAPQHPRPRRPSAQPPATRQRRRRDTSPSSLGGRIAVDRGWVAPEPPSSAYPLTFGSPKADTATTRASDETELVSRQRCTTERAGPRRAQGGATDRRRASVGSAYGTRGPGPHRRTARPAPRRSSRRPGHHRAAS